MQNKSETQEIEQDYIAQAEAKWNLKVSKFRCDNGGQYIKKQFKEWSRQIGIIPDCTTLHTPQLNEKPERLNRTSMEIARALIGDSCLEKKMWGEGVKSAAYLLNRSPTETLSVTPAEKWNKKKPDLYRWQIFESNPMLRNELLQAMGSD